jgi:hypothetical protein
MAVRQPQETLQEALSHRNPIWQTKFEKGNKYGDALNPRPMPLTTK